jgi:uncharacterized protein (DUF2384 family)
MPSSTDSPDSAQPASAPRATPLPELLEKLKDEISVKDLWKIATRIGMSAEQFEELCGASPHRLRRGRGGDELVDVAKNTPFVRCGAIFGRVVALCNGDESAARNWVNSPAPVLKGKKPIEAAQTAPGAKNVEALVAQLEAAAGIKR